MTNKNNSFIGRTMYVYDTQGQLLVRTEINDYDSTLREIEIESCPASLEKGGFCQVTIAADPTPLEFKGKVMVKRTISVTIALFQQKVKKESRQDLRYKVNATALIESLIYGDRAYRLLHPLTVRLLDISKNGVRLSAASDAMRLGDHVEICLNAGAVNELILAEVVNCHPNDSGKTESSPPTLNWNRKPAMPGLWRISLSCLRLFFSVFYSNSSLFLSDSICLISKPVTFSSKSAPWAKYRLSSTKVFIIWMLTCIAISLLRTDESIAIPCSVYT